MTTEPHETETDSLGQFLRKTRIELGLELDQVGEETKISASNLKAMEADDYGALPADAFAKGFYSLYAKALNLPHDEIVNRFLAERGSPQRKNPLTSHNPPAHKAAQQISNMAEPSGVSPMSTIGFVLLLLILLAGGVCWYFEINPATFISEKLRGIQEVEVPGEDPSDVDNSNREVTEPSTGEEKSAMSFLHVEPPALLAANKQNTLFHFLLSPSDNSIQSVAHLEG